MRKKVVSVFKFIKQVFTEFLGDNVIKYSASLAYYTILSLAPLMVIILSVIGFIFGKKTIGDEMFREMTKLVGSDSAMQIQSIIENIKFRATVFLQQQPVLSF